jgi:two-component sensor histidine kinase
MGKERVQVDVSFLPDAPAILLTQRVVMDVSRRFFSDEDVGWRLGMAAHELMDNARKYGQGEVARLRFAIEPTEGGHCATIDVHSRGSAADIRDLERAVVEITQAADTQAAYLAAMRRAGPRDDQTSGFGLARIVAEGEMVLSLTVNDGRVGVNACLHVATESR